MRSPLKVTCFVPAFNAGETTRGIELCRGLVAAGLERGRDATVRLVYPTSDYSYEAQIASAGFHAQPLDVHLDQPTVSQIMSADHEAKEFISDLDTARRFIRAVMDDILRWPPDLILHGFVPPVGIAARILKVPTVVYLPFPAYRPWVRRHLLPDIPDHLETRLTSRAPAPVRRALVRFLSLGILNTGFFQQPTFAAAGRELGWKPKAADLITTLDAPLQLLTDLPSFYRGHDVGPHTRITGPLFSKPSAHDVPPEIRQILAPGPQKRVFVSMGSSGEKACLLAAAEALSTLPFRAVVVVPPGICSLSELRDRVRVPDHVLLTESFIPAHHVNPMADAAIIHGGQGTVQTAISSGTPIVGVGMQVEQSSNLENVARRGAGIRLRKGQWTAENIRDALGRVLDVPSFRQSAARLQAEANAIDGRQQAAQAIWDFVATSGLQP